MSLLKKSAATRGPLVFQQALRGRGGSSILELAVCLAMVGPVLLALTTVMDVGVRYFARARAAQMYHLHVEPIEILLAKQVRNCRFAVYQTLADAQVENPAAVIPAGNVLRADRLDGGGWFILQWVDAEHTLNLITNSGPGLPFTRSLRLGNGETSLFDTSQGFLAVHCALPVPPALVLIAGTNVSEIDYVLTAERQQ
jgi:hypothetical protein